MVLLKSARDGNPDRVLVRRLRARDDTAGTVEIRRCETALGDIDRLTDTSLHNSETAMKSYGLRGMLRCHAQGMCGPHCRPDGGGGYPACRSPTNTSTTGSTCVRRVGQTLNCLNRPTEAPAIYSSLLEDKPALKAAGPGLVWLCASGQGQGPAASWTSKTGERGELAESLRILQQGIGDSDSFTMGEALGEAGSFHVDLEEFECRERVPAARPQAAA